MAEKKQLKKSGTKRKVTEKDDFTKALQESFLAAYGEVG